MLRWGELSACIFFLRLPVWRCYAAPILDKLRGATFIVTHNTRDFQRALELGIEPVTPGEFLAILSAP